MDIEYPPGIGHSNADDISLCPSPTLTVSDMGPRATDMQKLLAVCCLSTLVVTAPLKDFKA